MLVVGGVLFYWMSSCVRLVIRRMIIWLELYYVGGCVLCLFWIFCSCLGFLISMMMCSGWLIICLISSFLLRIV